MYIHPCNNITASATKCYSFKHLHQLTQKFKVYQLESRPIDYIASSSTYANSDQLSEMSPQSWPLSSKRGMWMISSQYVSMGLATITQADNICM